MIDVEFLRTFVMIYRSRSLTAAGRVLHLSQPAVSNHLKALEARLGMPLFLRHARGVEPTAAGHELAAAAGPHLEALESLTEAVGEHSRVLGGTVRLGGEAHFLAEHALRSLIPLARQGVRFIVHSEAPADLLPSLGRREIDLAITEDPRNATGVVTERFCEVETVLVAAPGFAAGLPAAGAARIEAISAGPFVAASEQMMAVRRYYRQVAGVELTAPASFVAPDHRALVALAIAGAGLAVVPRPVVVGPLARGELVELRLSVQPATLPTQPVFLAYRSGALRTRRIAATRAALLEAATAWSPEPSHAPSALAG